MVNALVNFPGLDAHDMSSLTIGAVRRLADAGRSAGAGNGKTARCRFLHVYGMTEAAPLGHRP